MSLLPVFSYGLSSLAYALLALLLWFSWRGRSVGLTLILAAVATAMWGGLLAWASWSSLPAVVLELAELFRLAAWLIFLAVLLGPLVEGSRWLQQLRVGALVVAGGSLVGVVGLRSLNGALTAPADAGLQAGFVIAGLVLALLGLVMLEQLYRNRAESRRSLTFMSLAVATVLAYDLYLYSNALLFQGFRPALWDARGLVNALCVPLLLVAARRNADWHFNVFVSRDVAFHSAVIAGSGAYLLVIALGGYYVRDFGGTWGEFAQIAVIVSGVITLGLFLTSDQLRRKTRVLISKHFFNKKYDYREEWLRLTSRLTAEDDGLDPYERSVHVIADVFDSPGGAIWRKGDEGYELAGSWPPAATARESIDATCAMVGFLESSQWVIEVDELVADPEKYERITLPQPIAEQSRLWLIIPLWHRNSLRGFVTLDESSVSPGITWEDRDLLKTLGRQVAAYLSQYEDALALAEAQQFEAFGRLTAFLMHDLKNLIAQQSLIVKNADKHRHNPEFIDDALETVAASVKRMERLLEHLQRRRKGTLVERVDVQGVVEEAVRRCADRSPCPTLVGAAVSAVIEAERDALVMVLVHLVRNAQDATPADGRVEIRLAVEEEFASIQVVDTGAGMSEAFIRSKLFQPFVTTKSAKGMGIGAHQAREFARTQGGRLTVTSSPGKGSCFTLRLPLV